MGTECLFYQLDSHGGLYSTMHEFNTPGHLTGLKKVNFVAFYHHQKRKEKELAMMEHEVSPHAGNTTNETPNQS